MCCESVCCLLHFWFGECCTRSQQSMSILVWLLPQHTATAASCAFVAERCRMIMWAWLIMRQCMHSLRVQPCGGSTLACSGMMLCHLQRPQKGACACKRPTKAVLVGCCRCIHCCRRCWDANPGLGTNACACVHFMCVELMCVERKLQSLPSKPVGREGRR